MQMLAARVELHAPACSGGPSCACHPILDLEKFVQAVVTQHFGGGARQADGTFSGAAHLNCDDRDDLSCYLIAAAWEASRNFRSKDDGRSTNRLSGYVMWILHRRAVDWQRHRFGSTRYKRDRPSLVEFDDRVHGGVTHDDYPSDNGRHLDRQALSPKALDQLALLEMSIETNRPIGPVAHELGVSPSMHVLQREAVVCD